MAVPAGEVGEAGQVSQAGQAGRAALRPLLEARSVAVVGASTRQGSFGNALVRQVLAGGFAGTVRPVNPRYRQVEGLPCVPSLADLPQPAELALLAVGPDRVEAALQAAADAGTRAAVVYASLPEAGVQARLQAIAAAAGMAVCGANCMGFVNLERSLRACAYAQPPDLRPGPVTFISHSGSAFSALLHNHRGVRFNVVVSAGTEFGVTMDGYLDYALGLPSTRAIGLFMETSRNPAGLRRALGRAAGQDVPVVCLKVGRDVRSREFVTTHTGALAGDDAAYDAVFAAYGVLRVADLDEMMDTLELLTAGRRPGPGGLAAVTDSGGERALLSDVAADLGVPFARVADRTLARLRGVLSSALVPDNPLDAWDALEGAEQVFTDSLLTLHNDGAVAAVALAVDLTTEESSDVGYVAVAEQVQAATTKPFLVLSHVSSAVDPRDARRLRDAGVPVLEGTRTGLAAVRNIFARRDWRARPPAERPGVAADITRRWRARLADPAPLTVGESFGLLADYGIPVVPTLPAARLEEAIAAAERIGWPVVLKTAAAGIAHKSDAGGVRLGITGSDLLAAAYAEMSRSLGPDVTVSAAVPPGAELALGIVRDPQFGPLVMAGAGGVLVELIADRVFGLPPLDMTGARAMLGGLKARRLLDGFRGAQASDVTTVAGALVRLSALAADVGDLISGLDINPLIAGPSGCVAVDVLIARRLSRGHPGYAAPVPRPAASAPQTPGPTGVEAAADGAGAQRIQAVDRAMALLKSVAASTTPPTVLELARASGINRSTAWRLLRTLEHHGLVDRDPITQRYTVGYGAVSVASGVTDDALVRRVRPLLEDLAVRTGESVTLAVAKRFNLVYVDQVDPPHVMAPSWLDKPLPLHATSGGKVFLAWLRRDERDAILPRDLPRYTSRTITDREALEREFDEIRRTGYALCTREYEEFSSGASAAVLNSRQYPIAVVNVWGPAPRNPAKRLHEIGREAVKTADEVRNLVG